MSHCYIDANIKGHQEGQKDVCLLCRVQPKGHKVKSPEMSTDTLWSLLNFWTVGNDKDDFQGSCLKAVPRENCETSSTAKDDSASLQCPPGSRTAQDLTQILREPNFMPKTWMQTGIFWGIVSNSIHLPFFTALKQNNWDCFRVQKERYPSEVCNPINVSFIWPRQNPLQLGSKMKLGNEHQTAVKALTIAEPFVFKEQAVNKIKCTSTERGRGWAANNKDLITAGGKPGIKIWVTKHSS